MDEIKALIASDDLHTLDTKDWTGIVEELIEEVESEQRWANHYHSKLVELQRAGMLPDGFEF